MGGFLGFGVSGTESKARNNLDSVFNYGLSTGQRSHETGEGDVGRARASYGDAAAYFSNLLKGGRTSTAINSAPAVNAAQDQADAIKREEAAHGTGRGGGTAADNRELSTTTAGTIDDIINANLVGGKANAAQGLTTAGAGEAALGSTNLADTANLLGLGSQAESGVLKSGMEETKARAETGRNVGMGIAKLLTLL